MSNLELILSFIAQHPWISFFLAVVIFSWTPIKIEHNYSNKEDKD